MKPQKKIKANRYLILLILLSIPLTAFSKGGFDENLCENYFEIADGYAEIKKYDKALYFYNKASKNPTYKAAAKYNMARINGLKNDWKSAKNLLAQLYESDSENRLIYTAYAYALVSSGDIKRGLEMYEKIYKSEPENPEATINYIRMLIAAKKYSQAQNVIEKGMIKFTDNEEKHKLDSLKAEVTQKMNPPQKTPKSDSK